ncbi:pyridoxal-phosphate dependent enzyme [Kribbella orskensis]|uniref:Pyridoxal-phosphate dependent enzyme n=1 Tax=Kribbella orskensis TaxID=2512216 RepID=A0ABY2BDA2_9ACTN|nr:pyridoxal-phosphate dependent enzyme [Kribbella sp. VKM Ac-2500]TCO17029.1 pyridoxal-phosphate dependent enzyme [Kribbella orskensis]
MTVTDAQILAAVRYLAVEGRLVAEPAGATAVAACLNDKVPVGPGAAAIVSGGSIDPKLLSSVLES